MNYAVGVKGAVSFICPTRTPRLLKCRCGRCATCGYPVHSAVHMHALGDSIDGPPFHHAFVGSDTRPAEGQEEG